MANNSIKKLLAIAALLSPIGANAALIDGDGFIETGANGPTTIDEWYFSVTTAGTFEILAEGETSDFLDPEMNLFGPGGFIENDDDGWANDLRSSWISRLLEVGDYVLYVSAFNFNPGEQGGATHNNGPLDEDGDIQNQGDYFLSINGTGAAHLTQIREGNLDGSFTTTAVSEPGTLALLGLGLLGMGMARRRKIA